MRAEPLRNRVQPDGTILACPERGLFMGNRGILHDDRRRLGAARWRHRAWVCCVLRFKGRRRVPMTPGTYTELFFLDEAVALAAGHRPCAECRRADYDRWRTAWEAAHGTRPGAPGIDAVLHAARAIPGARHLRRHEAGADTLPDGAMVDLGGTAHLILGGAAQPCSPAGYGPPVPRPSGPVTLLTPPPTVEVLRHGYHPALHPTARRD